ncbi:MAG: class I SAM-dependent methyltransferase [Tissierellia bacterium]|nr:class I SAM-dependent methyltransferase [Tissierellia bacterium]
MRMKKRLFEIVKLVEKDKFVIDVGTDHGLVPLYLAKNGISKKILATDISKNSLDKLNSEVFDQYRHIIKTKVTDGFKEIKSEKNQIAIIAGMGANTIIDILEDSVQFVKRLDYLIIQSNINNELLRRYLIEADFSIVKDFIVVENNKYYDIIKVIAKKSDINYDLSDFYFGKENIESKNEILKEKLEKEYKKNLKFRENIINKSKDRDGLNRIDERIKAIKEVYKKWS